MSFDVRQNQWASVEDEIHQANSGKSHREVICETDRRVQIGVRDLGEGFDLDAVSNPLDREKVSAGHGYSVYLIRHLMGEVQYIHGGREIKMRES